MNPQIASESDAAKILQLQKLAYTSEAELYHDYTIAPLVQTLEEMVRDIQKQTVLKVLNQGRITGSVRGYINDDTGYIGRLMVHPEFQNQGIGKQLMQDIEERLSPVKRFELFTGNKSERNLYLYRKLGYHIFRTETVNDQLAMVFLEKIIR